MALVVVDEPSAIADSGGKAAAPIFAEFAEFAARQLRIPSENEKLDSSLTERVLAITPEQAQIINNIADSKVVLSEEIAGSVVD